MKFETFASSFAKKKHEKGESKKVVAKEKKAGEKDIIKTVKKVVKTKK
jgi:hypothetical protein